eukprot:489969-Prymnesium_polylepis.1
MASSATVALFVVLAAPGVGSASSCLSLKNHDDMIYTAQLGLGTPVQVRHGGTRGCRVCAFACRRTAWLPPVTVGRGRPRARHRSERSRTPAPIRLQYVNVVADTGSMDLLVLSKAAACQGALDCGSNHNSFDGA